MIINEPFVIPVVESVNAVLSDPWICAPSFAIVLEKCAVFGIPFCRLS